MFEPILNPIITNLKESATLAINQRAKALRREGRTIYHFGFGQSPFPVAKPIQEALAEHSHQKEYLPSLGLEELRKAFCQFYKKQYGYHFDPSCVLVGPGSKELIFQSIFILEGPLIIPGPSWVSYGPQAHIRGKSVFTIQTKRENDFKLTAEELQDACSKLLVNRQKLLILNNPNNPTGTVYEDQEIKALSEVCREHGVIVISDEIYALCDYSDRPYRGFSEHYPEGTIVTSGLSKGHSAGGYRLGMLAAPSNMKLLMKSLAAMVSETFSAVSAPTQYAAITAYEDNADVFDHAENCTAIHRMAGKYLYKRFRAMGLKVAEPEGGFYLFPCFEKFTKELKAKGIQTAQALCHTLLDEYGVAVLPADDFYCPPDMLACRVATVDYDGAAVLDAYLDVKTSGGDLGDKFVEKNCPNLKGGADAIERFLKSL